MVLAPAGASGQVVFEYYQGTAFNVPTTLTITQADYPRTSSRAHYSVRPLDDIWYYNLRAGYWKKNAGWVLEFLHHKIYLENPPSEIESFEVTHGYNLVTLNRAWRRGQVTFLAGGGVVVAHSHSTIRGRHRPISAPTTLAGATAQGAAGRRLNLTRWLFASVEGKLTASWARVPIADGRATVPNIAFHALAGLGVEF